MLTATNKKLVTFLFWTATKTNYISKYSYFQKKYKKWLIPSPPAISLKFKENNENNTAAQAFLAGFLFQSTAEPNRPNSWFRRRCHSTPYNCHGHHIRFSHFIWKCSAGPAVLKATSINHLQIVLKLATRKSGTHLFKL